MGPLRRGGPNNACPARIYNRVRQMAAAHFTGDCRPYDQIHPRFNYNCELRACLHTKFHCCAVSYLSTGSECLLWRPPLIREELLMVWLPVGLANLCYHRIQVQDFARPLSGDSIQTKSTTSLCPNQSCTWLRRKGAAQLTGGKSSLTVTPILLYIIDLFFYKNTLFYFHT